MTPGSTSAVPSDRVDVDQFSIRVSATMIPPVWAPRRRKARFPRRAARPEARPRRQLHDLGDLLRCGRQHNRGRTCGFNRAVDRPIIFVDHEIPESVEDGLRSNDPAQALDQRGLLHVDSDGADDGPDVSEPLVSRPLAIVATGAVRRSCDTFRQVGPALRPTR